MDQVIAAGIAAIGTPGFLGLHLEGPHLDPRRKGAHDPRLIRPMTGADLSRLLGAAEKLPALMVTLAPSSVSPDQVAALSAAGVIVSIGHSDCTGAEAQSLIAAGARCATHLFNAMSQIANREPGLAGTALTRGIACGLIADGIHVHPDVMRLALAAKPEGIFLVSDCMAAAGTDQTEFRLGGRRILRRDGRLTLEDGTLAGADLTLPRALQVLTGPVGLAPERAFAMASRIPADLIARPDLGRITPGLAADLVALTPELDLAAVWQAGDRCA
jgi:N-acetylglucosamine-6-phosphate deacetylase